MRCEFELGHGGSLVRGCPGRDAISCRWQRLGSSRAAEARAREAHLIRAPQAVVLRRPASARNGGSAGSLFGRRQQRHSNRRFWTLLPSRLRGNLDISDACPRLRGRGSFQGPCAPHYGAPLERERQLGLSPRMAAVEVCARPPALWVRTTYGRSGAERRRLNSGGKGGHPDAGHPTTNDCELGSGGVSDLWSRRPAPSGPPVPLQSGIAQLGERSAGDARGSYAGVAGRRHGTLAFTRGCCTKGLLSGRFSTISGACLDLSIPELAFVCGNARRVWRRSKTTAIRWYGNSVVFGSSACRGAPYSRMLSLSASEMKVTPRWTSCPRLECKTRSDRLGEARQAN